MLSVKGKPEGIMTGVVLLVGRLLPAGLIAVTHACATAAGGIPHRFRILNGKSLTIIIDLRDLYLCDNLLRCAARKQHGGYNADFSLGGPGGEF